MQGLDTALAGLAGGTASVDPATGNVSITALNNTDSITVGGTANVGDFGLAAGTTAPSAGTRVSLSEDVAGSPFGLKIASVSSTLTGANVTGPTGSPPAVTVDLATNPNPGDTLTYTFNLPDGTTQQMTLTATTSSPPAAGQFTIGASPAATATNLQAALTSSVEHGRVNVADRRLGVRGGERLLQCRRRRSAAAGGRAAIRDRDLARRRHQREYRYLVHRRYVIDPGARYRDRADRSVGYGLLRHGG